LNPSLTNKYQFIKIKFVFKSIWRKDMKLSNNSASFSLVLSFALTVFVIFGVHNAFAAPQPLPFDFSPGIGDLEWEGIEDIFGDTSTGSPFSGDCDDSGGSGLAIDDATSADDSSDAYDTAWLTTFGTTFVGTGGVGDLTGSTYTAVPQNISGLDVTYQLFFSEVTQCNRLVLFFDNPTGTPIRDTVRIATNFGSDDDTEVNGTSSGDTIFTTADRWIVTSDGFPASDPVNTTVFYGPGGLPPAFVTESVCDDSGDEGVGAEFDLNVPEQSTRCLMLFACLGEFTGTANTISGALADAPLFDSLNTIPGDLLSGLSQEQIDECVNWNFAFATIPTLSEWGLIAMAGVLGVFGFIVLRRRTASQS
jgi:IPTL-CTERM motif